MSLCLALWAATAGAGVTNQIETWSRSIPEGWKRTDTLNGTAQNVTNTADALSFSFKSQETPIPGVDLVYADASASGGRFVGDYVAAGVENVKFKLYCEVAAPDQVRLYFGNSRNQRQWYHPVTGLKTGEWVAVDIPLEYADGWRLWTGPTHEKFIEDLRSVSWIGIRFQRSSANLQQCRIDEFALCCCANPESGVLPDVWVQKYFGGSGTYRQSATILPGDDHDGDGMSNYAEYLAGTDPTKVESSLAMILDRDKATNATGFVVQWNSVTNRSYVLWRSENLPEGFYCLDRHIPGTPPRNIYNDETATNSEAYFYRVSAEF